MANDDFKLGGQQVPQELAGPLRDSSALVNDPRQLRRRMADEGYLFIRGALDPHDVSAARKEVFSRLVEVGEIKPPAVAGIATGTSLRRQREPDLIAFWRSISNGPLLRRISHGPQIGELMRAVFGAPARPHDYLWLRPRPVGWSTGLHYDHPFFARGSRRVHTVWVALGDIPLCDGPLTLAEGSHQFQDLVDSVHGQDKLVNASPTAAAQTAFEGQWSNDVLAFVRQRNSRLMSADMRGGDVVVFGMDTLHGALDNHSPIGRVRLSCDVRYQPAADPLDERYFGRDPTGASGAGYGDMNSCQPLNEVS